MQRAGSCGQFREVTFCLCLGQTSFLAHFALPTSGGFACVAFDGRPLTPALASSPLELSEELVVVPVRRQALHFQRSPWPGHRSVGMGDVASLKKLREDLTVTIADCSGVVARQCTCNGARRLDRCQSETRRRQCLLLEDGEATRLAPAQAGPLIFVDSIDTALAGGPVCSIRLWPGSSSSAASSGRLRALEPNMQCTSAAAMHSGCSHSAPTGA